MGKLHSKRIFGDGQPARLRSAWALAFAVGMAAVTGACDSEDPAMMQETMEDDDGGESTGEPEPPPAECEPGGGEPTIMLGDGSAGFMDIDEVELVFGPQGGYHIVLGIQATFIDASGELSAELSGTVDGEVLGTCSPSVTLSCNRSAASLETSGILLIWDPGVEPEDLDGKTTTVDLSLTDAEGSVYTTSRDFVIRLP